MKITISKENYLKAIAEAEAQGEPVIAATLARWLGVSAPAVTMATRRLKRDKLIAVDAKGIISLAGEGRVIADRILRRHHLIERMLVEIFGMEWYKVHDEAERLEHAVSADFEQLLLKRLGDGKACAHGNESEIASPEAMRERGWQRLDEVTGPIEATVVSVYERDRELLEYLDGIAVQPGARLQVIAARRSASPGAEVSLRVQGRPVKLDGAVARKVWVRPERVPVVA